ncbi:MAG: helix-turn-helix domain-containing protein [Bacillota bacterium]|nr:helix-turn-helix domain-containing protein [Bacillota bacterium]
MEVLTTGEKIKRARIYNGLTLKDISSDIVSISKLSGIENNKILPEDKIIEYLSSRLNLSEDYIKEDIPKQLLNNYSKLLKNKKGKNYIEDIKYNLNYAINCEECQIAFKFMHLLIEYYINGDKISKAENDLAEYYDLLTKANSEENNIIYYLDLGTYLYKYQEYNQAVKCFIKVKNKVDNKKNSSIYYKTCYYIIMAYFQLNKESEFLDTIGELKSISEIENCTECPGEIYSLLAVLYYERSKEKYEDYRDKAFEYFINGLSTITVPINFGMIMMKFKSREEGIKILTKAYSVYNKKDKKGFAAFSNRLVRLFIDNELYNEAEEIIEETINNAIYLNDDYYIEKAYFYKAIVLGEKGDTDSKELYMNLSLDSLKKNGSTKDIYNRYLLIGKMYHDSKKYQDSINYFNLALKLKGKL